MCDQVCLPLATKKFLRLRVTAEPVTLLSYNLGVAADPKTSLAKKIRGEGPASIISSEAATHLFHPLSTQPHPAQRLKGS
jgi:hypothetical protein